MDPSPIFMICTQYKDLYKKCHKDVNERQVNRPSKTLRLMSCQRSVNRKLTIAQAGTTQAMSKVSMHANEVRYLDTNIRECKILNHY